MCIRQTYERNGWNKSKRDGKSSCFFVRLCSASAKRNRKHRAINAIGQGKSRFRILHIKRKSCPWYSFSVVSIDSSVTLFFTERRTEEAANFSFHCKGYTNQLNIVFERCSSLHSVISFSACVWFFLIINRDLLNIKNFFSSTKEKENMFRFVSKNLFEIKVNFSK